MFPHPQPQRSRGGNVGLEDITALRFI